MVVVNIDVIALIIEHVGERNTLFSLLTVNRQVFRETCRVLYRDPLRFFWDQDLTDRPTQNQVKLLLQLLLTLSPAADDDANLARSVFGAPLRHKSEAVILSTMMLDYLSFVKYIRWENRLCFGVAAFQDKPSLRKATSLSGFRSVSSFVNDTVTRMICHHRLADVVELEIELDAIDRFIDLAPHLRCLRYISIASFSRELDVVKYKIYPHAFRFIQAFQQHHGKDQLLDCRFGINDRSTLLKAAFDVRTATFMLLPPLFPRSLKLAHPIRPTDSYLSRIDALSMAQPFAIVWGEVSRDYSDMSAGQILQRCRSLTWLGLDCTEGKIHDANVFAWAADEARQRARRTLFVPAVPLRALHLELSRRPLAVALRILVDAIVGFSLSLETLRVDYGSAAGEVEEGEGEAEGEGLPPRFPTLDDVPMGMTNLTRLTIESTNPRLVGGSFLNMCTSLTRLVVFLTGCIGPNRPSHGWPVICIPNLTSLKLGGMAINLFDPASLHRMPRLVEMKLSSICKDMDTSGDGLQLLDRWTWDWNLPMLTRLTLENMLTSSAGFSFKILRGCPKLKVLTLEFPESAEQQPLYPIEIVSVLTDSKHDVFRYLKVLQLQGRFSLLAEDLEALIGRVLPCLDILSLGTIGPCTATQVVEYTKRHKMLTEVRLHHAYLDEELCQVLGLVGIDSYGPPFNESAERFIHFKFQDSENSASFFLKRCQ